MKIKQLTIAAIILPISVSAGNAASVCQTLFADYHCATWSENGNLCDCASCSAAFPNSIGYGAGIQKTYNNTTYFLHTGCTCNNCKCDNNPDSTRRSGSCTCGSDGAANYSTCTATGATETCTRANCTKGWPITINGVFYCGKQTDSNCTSSVTGARTAMWVSTQCRDGYGVTNTLCAVAACSSGTISTDRSHCVCTSGTYGTNPTACNSCPGDGTSDEDFHASLGPYHIGSCYLPDGTTGSDSTGNWKIDGGKCYYSQN